MTTAADDRASGDAFEALLAGRPVPGGAAGLAAFTGAVRGAATRPGRPNAALAELLSTGLLTDQSSPSTRTAPTAGTTRSRGRTRRRFTVIVPALIAKFLAAGAAAQAATGAGLAVAVVATAGTAGVLPGETQEAFSDLTGIEQPAEETAEEELPPADGVEDGGDGSLDPADPTLIDGDTEEIVVEAPPATELTDAEAAALWAEEGTKVTSQAEFKAWLALGKENGWVTGPAVSAAAHARNEARKTARDAAEEDSEETPETETPEVVETPEGEDGDDESETELETADDEGSTKAKTSGKGGGEGKGRG